LVVVVVVVVVVVIAVGCMKVGGGNCSCDGGKERFMETNLCGLYPFRILLSPQVREVR